VELHVRERDGVYRPANGAVEKLGDAQQLVASIEHDHAEQLRLAGPVGNTQVFPHQSWRGESPSAAHLMSAQLRRRGCTNLDRCRTALGSIRAKS